MAESSVVAPKQVGIGDKPLSEEAKTKLSAAGPSEPSLTDKEHLTLAKVELGTDYTAKISIGGFQFKVHYPSMMEDQKILIEQERQFDGIQNPSIELRLNSLMWATLDIVVTEIWKIEGENQPRRVNGQFSTIFKTLRNASVVYSKVVLPLYNEYLGFETKLNAEVDPLKNV